jgi:uncharacterized protein
MPTLVEQINSDLIATMKDRDPAHAQERELKLIVLRTLNAEIKTFQMNNRKTAEDADVIAIVTRGIKQFRETLDKAVGANEAGVVREDIAEKERAKIAIYERYLPTQLSAAEIENLVIAAMSETGATSPKDMGAVMAVIRPKTAGKADGKLVSEIVKKKLNGG